MKYEIYQGANMIALEKNEKWGLFYFEDDQESLVPVKFAQNLTYLQVYEQTNLAVTPDGVYTLFGEKVVETTGKPTIVELPFGTLIITDGGLYGKKLSIWNGSKILMEDSCTDFRYSERCLALKYGTVWSLFETDGTIIEEGVFDADDIEIHRDFVVTKNLGKQGLYSLKKRDFLKKNQLKILCSDSCDLVLCAQIGSSDLNVYSQGRWHSIPMGDEFGLVTGLDHMFYIKRGKKYFVYDDDVHRFMRYIYPNGVDFISCNEQGMLMMVDKNKSAFFKR